jgi:hypothetical protein
METDTALRRVNALRSHLTLSTPASATGDGLQVAPTAALAARTLPRFDVGAMEAYLDDLRGMKLEVYELLRQHPELLPPVLEGMTKGAVAVHPRPTLPLPC